MMTLGVIKGGEHITSVTANLFIYFNNELPPHNEAKQENKAHCVLTNSVSWLLVLASHK